MTLYKFFIPDIDVVALTSFSPFLSFSADHHHQLLKTVLTFINLSIIIGNKVVKKQRKIFELCLEFGQNLWRFVKKEPQDNFCNFSAKMKEMKKYPPPPLGPFNSFYYHMTKDS